MATFNYGGEINLSSYQLKTSGAADVANTVVSIKAQDFQTVQVSGSSTITPSNAVIVLSDQSGVTKETAATQQDTYLAKTAQRGNQFVVGEDKTIITKVAYYRGKISGQYVFSKVNPPIGATEIVYLGLVPADL